MMGLSLFALLLAIIVNINGDIEKLDDRIRIYGGPEMVVEQGAWTLLLSISEPGIMIMTVMMKYVWISHNVAWGTLGIVLCVGMVLIVGGRYLHIKCKKINYFLADAKAPAKPKRSKIEPINLTEEAEMTPIRGATE